MKLELAFSGDVTIKVVQATQAEPEVLPILQDIKNRLDVLKSAEERLQQIEAERAAAATQLTGDAQRIDKAATEIGAAGTALADLAPAPASNP